jgi:transcriptional regulator with XRE-family HTH domain
MLIITNNVSIRRVTLLAKQQAILEQMRENVQLTHLRRKISTLQVAERAGLNRTTLRNIEKGSPRVEIGSYCQVLFVLGVAEDLPKIATDDEPGRRLQDAELVVKKRAPGRK